MNDLELVVSRSRPRLEGAWELITLEEGTCSHRAALVFAAEAFEMPPSLSTERSFNRVISTGRGRSRSIVLLPHLFEGAAELTLDAGWRLIHELSFFRPNPPLFLARRPAGPSTGRCAVLPALAPLVAESIGRANLRPADSTQHAARIVAREESCEICVTNERGLQTYGLVALEQLKHMDICWFPFTTEKESCRGQI